VQFLEKKIPKRKRLTASQKAQIVLETLREDKGVALIASENNIHSNQIHKWKKQALEDFVHLFEDEHKGERAKEAEHEKQFDELYAEIGRFCASTNKSSHAEIKSDVPQQQQSEVDIGASNRYYDFCLTQP
jgi:transposase